MSTNGDIFTVYDIKQDAGDTRFRDKSLPYLAGRCLLDVIEYLRVDPKFPATFRQLVNAHVIRVLLQCFGSLGREDLVQRFKPHVEATCKQLLESRIPQPPHYGDDLWDWAYTIDALLAVRGAYPDIYGQDDLRTEVESFYATLSAAGDEGLSFNRPGEWFGPGTAVAAYRILNRAKEYLPAAADLPKLLKSLKKLALTKINHGQFLGKNVVPDYHHWHYGQVVAEFPDESKWQYEQLVNFDSIKSRDGATQAFALARIIQGASRHRDQETCDAALQMVFACERQERPFSTGIIAETVKASVNVLEAIWPMLTAEQIRHVGEMIDRLLESYKLANTIGIAVAVRREFEECRVAFLAAGAGVQEAKDEYMGEILKITHPNYHAYVVMGKALAAAQEAAQLLINKYKAKWLLMVGIAGSLGDDSTPDERAPKLGDVIMASSLAPYKIRDKVREGEARNVPVPFRGLEWGIIPAHPGLFATALQAVQESETSSYKTHAGLVVTGTGIKDDLEEKKKILKEYPGALAAEEESYMFSLVCALYGKPYLVLRGVSDLVGYKLAQQGVPGGDDEPQRRAARNAANLAARVVAKLSNGWAAHSAVK